MDSESESDSRMTTESLGISVPIPGKKTIFYRKEVLFGGFSCSLQCSPIPVPIPRLGVS